MVPECTVDLTTLFLGNSPSASDQRDAGVKLANKYMVRTEAA